MDTLERNLALALVLGRLESTLAILKGIEYKVFGISDEDRGGLEPRLDAAKEAVARAIQTTLDLLPEGGRGLPRRGH